MSRQHIVTIANQMLDETIGIVEGSIAICRARPGLRDEDLQAEVLFPFMAFESELQDSPIGKERQHWNEEALQAKDRRLNEIIAAARPEILEACRALIAQWSEHH